MEGILDIRQVSKSYSQLYVNDHGKKDVETNAVLFDLNLQVSTAKINALIGGNGAGKTTLFNMICGYLKPDKGEIIYRPAAGKEVVLTALRPWQTARAGIGRMFQTPRIFKNLTVLENMLLADQEATGTNPFSTIWSYRRVKAAEAVKRDKAETVFQSLFGRQPKFWQQKDQAAGSFSYGEQRLISLARLFMNANLQVILLDEPCSGVNEQVIEVMAEMLQKMAGEGKTTLLIEHNLDFVARCADVSHYLENGKVKLSGATTNVLNDPNLRENYST